MQEPKLILIGESRTGNVAALMLAIKESQEEVILVKDTEELREFIKTQHSVKEMHLEPTVMKIQPLKTFDEPFIELHSDKPFYHNIVNRRKKR